MMRFEFYGARALNNQLDSSEKYKDLKPVYQIIFIEKCAWNNKNLINHYQMRNEQGEDESKHPLIRRTYVHLPVINEIAKKKAIQQMDDFEQQCFLFENNAKNDILESKERLVKVFMDKYEEMRKDDELWSTAMAIQMGEARYRNGLRDSFEEGKAAGKMEGKIEGKLEGERQLLHRQMQIKFHEDCAMWLQALTEEQMHIVSTLVLECDTFESVKKRISKSDTTI